MENLEEGEINVQAQLAALMAQMRDTSESLQMVQQENIAFREENALLK